MRLFLMIVLWAAASAWAQQKPVEKKDESASGGATAPSPSFRRDAGASRALFDRLDKNRDGDGRIARSEFTSVESGDVAATRP